MSKNTNSGNFFYNLLNAIPKNIVSVQRRLVPLDVVYTLDLWLAPSSLTLLATSRLVIVNDIINSFLISVLFTLPTCGLHLA
jgi:hypothetical protein